MSLSMISSLLNKRQKILIGTIVVFIGIIIHSYLIVSTILFAGEAIYDEATIRCDYGLYFNEDYNPQQDSYEVDAVWHSQGTTEEIYIVKPDGLKTERIDSVGEKIEVSNLDEGDELRVIGVLEDGTKTVVQTYEVQN